LAQPAPLAADAKAKAFFSFMSAMGKFAAATEINGQKIQQSIGIDIRRNVRSPLRFLADQLRSFTGISKDIRRIPEKVEEACEALIPVLVKMGAAKGEKASNRDIIFIPLHMAPFMREKDFARFWWPSFKKLTDQLNAYGYTVGMFLEQDWTRYIDYLQDMKPGTHLWIEYGDMALFKKKLGDKHILTGGYPINMAKTGTVQQCEDEVKRLLDIVAPGGHYYFSWDKGPLLLKDVKMENVHAIIKMVKEYGVY
jgi:uroporphyrinogen-III decarboxylase